MLMIPAPGVKAGDPESRLWVPRPELGYGRFCLKGNKIKLIYKYGFRTFNLQMQRQREEGLWIWGHARAVQWDLCLWGKGDKGQNYKGQNSANYSHLLVSCEICRPQTVCLHSLKLALEPLSMTSCVVEDGERWGSLQTAAGDKC